MSESTDNKYSDLPPLSRKDFMAIAGIGLLTAGVTYETIVKRGREVTTFFSAIDSWMSEMSNIAEGIEPPPFKIEVNPGESLHEIFKSLDSIESHIPIEISLKPGNFDLNSPTECRVHSMTSKKVVDQVWGSQKVLVQEKITSRDNITITSSDVDNKAKINVDADIGISFDSCGNVNLQNLVIEGGFSSGTGKQYDQDVIKGMVVASAVRNFTMTNCDVIGKNVGTDLQEHDLLGPRGISIESRWKESNVLIEKCNFKNVAWDGVLGVGEVKLNINNTSFKRTNDAFRTFKDGTIQRFNDQVGSAAAGLWGSKLNLKDCTVSGYRKCFAFSNIVGGVVDGLTINNDDSKDEFSDIFHGYWIFNVFGRTPELNPLYLKGNESVLEIKNIKMDGNKKPLYELIVGGLAMDTRLPFAPKTIMSKLIAENWDVSMYVPYNEGEFTYPLDCWEWHQDDLGRFLVDGIPEKGSMNNIKVEMIHTKRDKDSEVVVKTKITSPKNFKMDEPFVTFSYSDNY